MKKIKGEKGIYQLEDGRYRVRTTAKCPRTGKMKDTQRTLKAGQTMADAIRMREALTESMRAPEPEPSQEARIITVADYADRWIEQKTRRLKPSTAHEYSRILGAKVLPQIGHLRIKRLVRHDVVNFVAWCERQSYTKGEGEDAEVLRYSSSTVKGWWRVLRALLKDAHADGFLEKDPTLRINPPKTGVSGRREKVVLTARELGALVWAAYLFTEDRYAEIVTLAYTGMRAGELWALRWEDIDLTKGEIVICRSVWRGEVTKTKTYDPRSVPVPNFVAKALWRHRQKQFAEQSPGFERGIVFPSDVGDYRGHGSLRKAFSLLTEHLGIDSNVTPQVLRRTWNTLMTRSQVDRIIQRSMMGHSDEQMTELYTGVSMEMKREALNQMVASQGVA